VSTSGYAKTALDKAKYYNISCLDIDELDNIEWILTDAVTVFERRLVATKWHISTDHKFSSIGEVKLYSKEGTEITKEMLATAVKQIMRSMDLKANVGEHHTEMIELKSDGMKVVRSEPNEEQYVTKLLIEITYEAVYKEEPLTLVNYEDSTDKQNVTRGAYGDISVEEDKYRIVMVEQADGRKKIGITPLKTK